jgi:hypothetical protein
LTARSQARACRDVFPFDHLSLAEVAEWRALEARPYLSLTRAQRSRLIWLRQRKVRLPMAPRRIA